MSNLYKKYAKGDIKNKEGGYKPSLYFAPQDTFLTLSLPVVGGSPALGDKYKIASDHTFGGSDGFINLLGKIDTATAKYTTDADGIAVHTFEVEIEGNSPELYQQLRDMVNDNVVCLMKDANCLVTDSYDQWGDTCLTPTIKVEFDAKTTAAGVKSHKITGTIRGHKYWYYGTLTEKPDVTPLACPIVTLSSTTTTVIANWGAVAGATNYDVKLFSDAAGLTQVGATQNVTTTGPVTFTGLTTATQYYVRVIPKNTQTSTTSCGLVGEKTA